MVGLLGCEDDISLLEAGVIIVLSGERLAHWRVIAKGGLANIYSL